ncbi:hypothetical protein [Streptomyces sp. NPDC058964]|uniref:hypothetical protein n=1 Tax=Streptomyces sp. NPDC058964 TaxID=3346681 RepID=UPI0036B86FDE
MSGAELAQGRRPADLTDVFISSSAQSGRTVLIMKVNPFTASRGSHLRYGGNDFGTGKSACRIVLEIPDDVTSARPAMVRGGNLTDHPVGPHTGLLPGFPRLGHPYTVS